MQQRIEGHLLNENQTLIQNLFASRYDCITQRLL